MNVSTLKPGDRVEGLLPYTVESIDKSGLNGEYEAVVRYDDGWLDRITFPADTAQRCAAVGDFGDGGDRCQLANHTDGDHAALALAAPMYTDQEYRTWGDASQARSADEPTGVTWADGFPKFEYLRAPDIQLEAGASPGAAAET